MNKSDNPPENQPYNPPPPDNLQKSYPPQSTNTDAPLSTVAQEVDENPLPDGFRRTSKDIPRNFAELRLREDQRISMEKAAPKGAKPGVQAPKKEVNITEHTFTVEELSRSPDYTASRIDVEIPENSQGLSAEEAGNRLRTYGENKLTPPKQTPAIIKFIKQFLGFFSLLLEGGGVLCLVAFILAAIQSSNDGSGIDYSNLYLGVVLLSVVFLTSVFTYAQESKSDKVMEGFKNLIPAQSVVIRDGEKKSIDATFLVPGDIVVVNGGNKIPADLRILSAVDMRVNNSSLTGEAEPQKRTPEFTHKNALETQNLAFFGTFATKGSAVALCVATGDATVMGTIAKLASSTSGQDTPLHREIHRFIYIITGIAVFLGVTFLIISIAYGYGIINNIIFMIGIIVANVPEGLLATVTVSLTLTSQRMAKKHVLVKNLHSVETLGSTTTICSDKTGTLTQNRMTVAHVFYDDSIWKCATNPSEKGNWEADEPSFQALQCVASLCSTATFKDDEENVAKSIADRDTIGDASETALIKFCEPIRGVNEYRRANPIKGAIPFNSKNKWQLHIHDLEDTNDPRKLLVMKGAPERILKYCDKILIEGAPQEMTPHWKKRVENAILSLGKMGERVLGFAQAYYDADHPDVAEGVDMDRLQEEERLPRYDLTFVGLMSMIDPPREGVPEAVEKCNHAGIQVIMVTGDHKVTAHAIAKSVGIVQGKTAEEVAEEKGIEISQVGEDEYQAVVVTGEDIASGIPEDEWDRILSKKHVVFARTSPQQKLIIVEHCQARGMIVAVTGDGVNDSPALKKADIGISMGITGSDVSKEAADMILMDDNFASIVNGVEEGRLIFDNLKKSIAYTLSSNIPEISPFLSFILFGLPLPLGTLLILCIDLGTDMVPAISLAYENAESTIMSRPPRDPKVDNLVTSRLIGFAYFQIGIIQALAGFYAYFVVMADQGFPPTMLPQLGADSFLLTGSEPTPNMFGEIIGHDTQADILQRAQTAFLVSIVVVQWADLLICKTRELSLFQQGLRNPVLNFGLFFETALIAFIVYVPFADIVLTTRPLKFIYWLPAVPWSVLILMYDELRKLLIRKLGKESWLYRYTYW